MNRKILTLSGIFLALFFFSCNNGKKKGLFDNLTHYSDSVSAANDAAKNAPPVTITYAQLFDKSFENKNVTVEGYLALPTTLYLSEESINIDLNERKGMFLTNKNFTISVPVGTGKSTMKSLPATYAVEDLQVTSESGDVLGVDAHVRVTGHLSSYGTLTVTKVETASKDLLDYTKLNPAKIDASHPGDTTLEGKVVCAEGVIEIPGSVMAGNFTFLYLTIKGISDHQTVYLQYGDKANQLEPLGSTYTEDDVKIHDKNGEIFGVNKKVRVYGVYSGDVIRVESIERI